jgi:hypothetical protein
MNRITAAARTPTLSVEPCGGVSAFSALSPPSPSVTPFPETPLTVSTRDLTSALATSSVVSGMVVRAMWRSGVTRVLSWYGEVIGPVTGEASSSAMVRSIVRRAAGSSIPFVALTASVSVSPRCSGKCCSISACALAESESSTP